MFCNCKKYDWVKRVCVIDSAYSLFIYFLLSTEEEIDSTFFFWSKGIPETVREKFKGRSYFCIFPKMHKKMYRIFLHYLFFPLKFPFLLKDNIEYWGHDHLNYSGCVIRSHSINIIEDGTKNYTPMIPFRGKKPRWYYRLVYGPMIFNHEYCFQAKWCHAEYLTGLDESAPSMHSDKCKKISIKYLWKSIGYDRQKKIANFYGLEIEDIKYMGNFERILLTQPFEGSEERKISFYREKIKLIGSSGLILKPHPREYTDYKKEFPDIPVFQKKIPLELLSLFGVVFKTAYTVNSTSIYCLPESTRKVVWDPEMKIESF